ncbi:MAG: energy transducer TonB [Gammaproteobacteria bacterium]
MNAQALPTKPTDRLGLTLFLAAVVHGIVILGIGFGAEKNRAVPPSLDVVLVQTPSQQAPKQARNIAQANQQASGSAAAKLRPASPALDPTAAVGQMPSTTHAARAARSTSAAPRVLTQAASSTKVFGERPWESADPGVSRSRVHMELARLSAELSQEVQRYAQRPRVSYIDSLSARTAAEAAYIRAWVDKVERVGNLNYPDDARRRALSGSLILHVLLDRDGNIVDVSVGSPSGQQVLDDAARRIVELAAPFLPLSADMRAQYDQLMITRTWIFEADGELTTR